MKSTITACALLIGGLAASPALSASFFPLPAFTDADFNLEVSSGAFSEDWVAESRGGTAGLSGDFELDILEVEPPGPGGPPADQAQFLWQNGVPVDFSVVYDGADVTYTVDGVVLNATNVNDLPSVDTIYIRTRSNSDGSSAEITNLVVQGMSYAGVVKSDDVDPIDYLKIEGVTGPFTLTGTSTFSWVGSSIPQRSRLAYQIKVGSQIPEPVSVLMVSLTAVAALVRRRV